MLYPGEIIMDAPPQIYMQVFSFKVTFNSEKLKVIEASDGSEMVKYIMVGYLQP